MTRRCAQREGRAHPAQLHVIARPLVALAALAVAAGAAAFDLQGHRGARGLAPENTLAAFALALATGVSTLELDLAMTRDGVVVVSHDARLKSAIARGPGGAWVSEPGPVIHHIPAAELSEYDVGRLDPASDYAKRFPHQRPADGERVPPLAAVFDLARRAGNDTVRFNMETKIDPRAPDLTPAPEPFAEAVVAAVRVAGMAARTTVQSFDWRTLRHVQAIAPEIATACLTASQDWLDNLERGRPGPSPWTAGLDVDDHGGSAPELAAAAGCRVWSPYHREVDRESVLAAHTLGLTVVPWTVNEPARMVELLEMGVDGLITDYPDRAREALAPRGVALPAPTPLAR